ncbi:MAG: guanylate kinase [bacterium]|nr:guanylate kinase [bacterium]
MELHLKDYESSVFVISAPSGVGKTTLRNILLSRLQNLYYSISCTTRPPRSGEVNGRDYFFVSPEVFQKKIEDHTLLEWAMVHRNLYGTPKEPIIAALQDKKDVLLDIDVQGARTLQQRIKGVITIFLLPPSWQVLEERLRSRKTETDEEIENRLRTAREEIKSCWEYDYLIVNNDLEEVVEKVKAIMVAEHCRPAKMRSFVQKLLCP